MGEGREAPFLGSKVTLPTCNADFFMLSPHIWTAFLALIPPSFTSLNPFKKFFKPLQHHSSSHNSGICMRILGLTSTLPVIYRKCSHAKQAVHTKSIRL